MTEYERPCACCGRAEAAGWPPDPDLCAECAANQARYERWKRWSESAVRLLLVDLPARLPGVTVDGDDIHEAGTGSVYVTLHLPDDEEIELRLSDHAAPDRGGLAYSAAVDAHVPSGEADIDIVWQGDDEAATAALAAAVARIAHLAGGPTCSGA